MTAPPRTLEERLRDAARTVDIFTHERVMYEAAAALDAQSKLLEALGNLVTRLDAIHEDSAFKSVWVINQLHAGPYTGPKYETELNNARAVLAKLQAATPPAEGDDGS